MLSKSRQTTVPLSLRLKAWWRGQEIVVKPAELDDAELVPQRSLRSFDDIPEWLTPAMEVLQRTWGDGLHLPGGENLAQSLVRPAGLDSTKSVLVIGGGPGGLGMAIAREFETWVTAYESNAEMAAAGVFIVEAAGMAKRANLSQSDYTSLDLKPATYDLVFSRECLFALPKRRSFLELLVSSLKPKGHFVMTDFVLDDRTGNPEELKYWMKTESECFGKAVDPWRVKDYAWFLGEKLALDLRIKEDITDRYVMETRAGFKKLMSGLGDQEEERPGWSDAVAAEVHLWTERLEALASGRLRVYRFHGQMKGAVKPMSNW